MADTLYVNVDGTPEQLDIAGSGTSPEYIERIEAVEAKTNPATETNMGIVYLTDSADSSKDAASHYAASPKALAELDKSAIKTVNGNAPDSDGNITPAQTGCLPLTGGTMTGAIVNTGGSLITIRRDTDDSYLAFFGGSTVSTGATLSLSGKDRENVGGFFQLVSKDGEGNEYTFVGRPNGNLTWLGSQVFLPAGAVFAFAANSDPAGCLLCNGAAVSRTTYAALFAAIGTTYGSGNGSTTFNLPNLTNKFIQGSGNAGTVKSAGLPNITGKVYPYIYINSEGYSGAIGLSPLGQCSVSGSGHGTAYFNFYASNCSSVYGNSTTVQPPALTMRYYIKY